MDGRYRTSRYGTSRSSSPREKPPKTIAPLYRQKKTRQRRVFKRSRKSNTRDIRSLLALWTLRHVKRNLFALFEGLESAHGNRGEVREKIFATIIRSNETETLGVIEPLNCTCCHIATSLKRDKIRASPTIMLVIQHGAEPKQWVLFTLVILDASSNFREATSHSVVFVRKGLIFQFKCACLAACET